MKLTSVLALSMLFAACGGGSGSAPTNEDGAPRPAAQAAGDGPDTSGLGEVVLGKINADPIRQEMKATAKLLDFKVVSVNTDAMGGTSSSVVECAGTVEFDADAEWGMSGVKKAGEPANFECHAEYVNQGNGWEIFGPMGIYPL